MIIFCFDNWQATDFLKEIITDIYSSFVLVEILMSFWNDFVFFCKFMIYHSICILWLDSDHSTAKYFNSFHSNKNFSRHSLCFDGYERRSHIIEDVIAISWNSILSFLSIGTKYIFFLETRKKIMQRILCLTRSTRTLDSIATFNSHDDEYEFLNVRRWQIIFSFLINNEYFSIFDFNEFVNVLSFTFFDMSFFRLDIILYIIKFLKHIKSNFLFSWLCNLSYLIWKSI